MKDGLVDFFGWVRMNKDTMQLNKVCSWLSVGGEDYGFQLLLPENESSNVWCTLFKASYDDQGLMTNFWVKDGWFDQSGIDAMRWDDNHIQFMDNVFMNDWDRQKFEELGREMGEKWIEPVGWSDAKKVLKQIGCQEVNWFDLMSLKMPCVFKKDKVQYFLDEAEIGSESYLEGGICHQERQIDLDDRLFLIKKTKNFMDLI